MCKPAIALFFLALSGAAFASPPDPCSSTQTINDAQLALRIPSRQSFFREGEIIPLELSFTSSVDNRYLVENKNYDRSGRLDIEAYCVDPPAPDPIADYFRVGMFIGGGLSSDWELTAKPFTATSELNEWKHLAPGHYRLYVVSHRVSRQAEPQESTPSGLKGIDLRSNTIDFDVVQAEREWQDNQLRDATAAFQNGTDKEKRAAARKLRFLNTKPALETLASLYWGLNDQPGGSDLMFGLFGSPYRTEAIAALQREIDNPNHPITRDFLNTLVKLKIIADGAWDPPTYDPARPSLSAEFSRKWEAHEHELMRASMAQTAAALPQKKSRAYTLTANALAELADYPIQKSLNP